MTRVAYTLGNVGTEVWAPSGYYRPLEEALVECGGRTVLYTVGTACVETSCCGTGSWQYLRVEGYVIKGAPGGGGSSVNHAEPVVGEAGTIQLETVEDGDERAAIRRLLLGRYPGARIEFR